MRVFITALLAGLALWSAAQAADLDAIKERGVIRVAIAPLSPFVIKSKRGEFVGFEIDSTVELAKHLGVTVQFIEKPFCELAETVLSGEADIIASGYSNTPERRRLLDFSLPYHDTEYFLSIERRKIKSVKTLRALNRKDVKLGYQIGGVSGMVAYGEFPGAELKGYSSFTQVLDAMKSGEIDGAVLFKPYIEMADDIDRLNYVVPHEFPLTRTIEAFAADQSSDALLDAINEWVIARDLDGYWDKLEKKWFSDKFAVMSAPPSSSCPSAIPQG